ncbi:hypothetical protein HYV49_05500 [Candidatus Pacearchaeota archaeon]|nr:hypothetical protein [Candidatus Pacearchaeota archaeon]
MREFEDFIENGDVRLQEKNKILASALVKSSEKGLRFVRKLEINEENSEHIVADIYDITRELIEAKLALDGYKSYSHEATILFLKKFKQFNESEINFMDNLRKTRNSIKYYGKEASPEDAEKTLKFMNSILPKLNKLIENDKEHKK